MNFPAEALSRTRHLTENPLRTGLSILGFFIGIASVLCMMAIGDGAKLLIEKDIEKLGYAQRAHSKHDLMRLDEALLDLDQAILLCEQQNLPPYHSLLLQLTHGLIVAQMERNDEI